MNQIKLDSGFGEELFGESPFSVKRVLMQKRLLLIRIPYKVVVFRYIWMRIQVYSIRVLIHFTSASQALLPTGLLPLGPAVGGGPLVHEAG